MPEACHLRMEAVDEAQEQRLALVGELRSLHGDADGLGQRLDDVVFVPDNAAVDLTALECGAVKREALCSATASLSVITGWRPLPSTIRVLVRRSSRL